MGLNCSHGAFDGPYSRFMRWRIYLSKIAGLPHLQLMEGFFEAERTGCDILRSLCYAPTETQQWLLDEMYATLPIQWSILKPDPLHILLQHSDWDGEIEAKDLLPIKESLERLLPQMDNEEMVEITRQFILGLETAKKANEPLLFY